MTSPFDRDPDVEAALRASLDAHARQAPDGDGLAERIIADTSSARAARPPHRSWGRFTLPAAAAILAAIVGITVAVVAANPDEHHSPPVAETTAPLPTVTVTRTPPPPTPTRTATPSTSVSTSATVDTSSLHDVRVIDLTFTSADDGWALASAQCILDHPRRCTAMMQTTDGVDWASLSGPDVNVPGIGQPCPCAEHVRFANDKIGYVYGPSLLWMTTDGGAHWQQLAGGALAIETADRNVVRLERSATGLRLSTSPLGSTTWTPRALGVPDDDSVTSGQLVRNGADVYLYALGLYRSRDDGASWTSVPDPCPAGHSAGAVAAGTHHRLAVTCLADGQPPTRGVLRTSDDAGGTFATRGALPQVGGLLAVGPSGGYVVALDRLSLTADCGNALAHGGRRRGALRLARLRVGRRRPRRRHRRHEDLDDPRRRDDLEREGVAVRKLLVVAAALSLAACSSSGTGSGSVGSRSVPVGPPAPVSTANAPSSAPSSAKPTVQPSSTAAPPSTLDNFRVADVTWVGSHGWALGEADCLSGPGRCDAIEQTTDGRTWTSLPAPPGAHTDADGTCRGVCVTGLRFATDRIGYAFGIAAFYTTADGGHSWRRQSGSAVALETLDGTAIRVRYPRGLPGPLTAQVAAVGSGTWTTVSLPGAQEFGSALGRAAGTSYLLTLGHPAGGGDSARSTLFLSRDGGHRWRSINEPCPQNPGSAGEVDSTALTVAPDGAAVVTCRPRMGRGAQFVAVVRPSGSIDVASRTALGSAEITGFGAASDKIILVVLADTFRSTDGGRSFARLAADAGGSPGNPRYLGFASATVGHALSADSRTIFTTSDAGRTWSAHQFG